MNEYESEASEQVNAVVTHGQVHSEAFVGLGCDDWCLGVRSLQTSTSCMGTQTRCLYVGIKPPLESLKESPHVGIVEVGGLTFVRITWGIFPTVPFVLFHPHGDPGVSPLCTRALKSEL